MADNGRAFGAEDDGDDIKTQADDFQSCVLT